MSTEEIAKVTMYKTPDGLVFDSLDQAQHHTREVRWKNFCDDIGVDDYGAARIWENRLAAINILGVVTEE